MEFFPFLYKNVLHTILFHCFLNPPKFFSIMWTCKGESMAALNLNKNPKASSVKGIELLCWATESVSDLLSTKVVWWYSFCSTQKGFSGYFISTFTDLGICQAYRNVRSSENITFNNWAKSSMNVFGNHQF